MDTLQIYQTKIDSLQVLLNQCQSQPLPTEWPAAISFCVLALVVGGVFIAAIRG